METKIIITKALSILNAQDWYYSYVDYGYMAAKESARQSMRAFVDLTNELPEMLREAMRDLWKCTCIYKQCFWPGHDASAEETGAYETGKERAMAIIEPMM